jgi:hypothetical protein
MTDPQTKRDRFVGYFPSEEDAARAYDCAIVKAHGPGAKRNFPGEAVSEPPQTKGSKRKSPDAVTGTGNGLGLGALRGQYKKRRVSSSPYLGVSWIKKVKKWQAQLMDPWSMRTGARESRPDVKGCCTQAREAATLDRQREPVLSMH